MVAKVNARVYSADNKDCVIIIHKPKTFCCLCTTTSHSRTTNCSFEKSGNTVRACVYFIIEMSDNVHYKGRFIKQKVLNKRLKAVAAMAEAKKTSKKCTKLG